MKLTILLILIFPIIFLETPAQNFNTPGYVLAELVNRTVPCGDSSITYKVVYPTHYDSTKKYPVFLALSAGLAFGDVVDFCYYTSFRSRIVRQKYLTILPVAPHKKTLKDLSSNEINAFLNCIIDNESITDSGWVVVGTSYGGDAAFNYARLRPKLFNGIIALPGNLEKDDVPPEWKDYYIMLAYGANDEQDWKDMIYRTKKKLDGKVKKLETFIIEGQQHVINPLYDLNILYGYYFNVGY